MNFIFNQLDFGFKMENHVLMQPVTTTTIYIYPLAGDVDKK